MPSEPGKEDELLQGIYQRIFFPPSKASRPGRSSRGTSRGNSTSASISGVPPFVGS